MREVPQTMLFPDKTLVPHTMLEAQLEVDPHTRLLPPTNDTAPVEELYETVGDTALRFTGATSWLASAAPMSTYPAPTVKMS